VDAANEYREEMDIIGRFVKERWILRPDATAVGSEMYKAYVSGAKRTGSTPRTAGSFTDIWLSEPS
jgi:phage/plasmid-associated DNA primase